MRNWWRITKGEDKVMIAIVVFIMLAITYLIGFLSYMAVTHP